MHFSRVVFVFLTIICSDIRPTFERMSPQERVREALQNFDLSRVMEVITEALGDYIIKENPSDYQKFFRLMFSKAELEVQPITTGGCDLKVSLGNAHFIFKFLVNETAEEALARIAKYNTATFFNVDSPDVFCVGVDLRRVDDAKRLICAWVVNLYFGNGTLKKSFLRESADTVLQWKNTTLKLAHNSSAVRQEPLRDLYDLSERVGGGARKNVYECVEKSSGNIFAAIIVEVRHIHEKKILYAEVDIMNELSYPTSHPNLLTLHEVFDNDDEFVMIVDLLDGDLRQLTPECGIPRNNYVRQICEGLKYMHARNIAHLDIKRNNVMFKNVAEDVHVVKIIDFSSAQKTNKIILQPAPVCQGFHYHDFNTPEYLENQPLGGHTDMWHVGVLTFNLLTGTYPLWGSWESECPEIDENIKKGRWTYNKEHKEYLPEEALHFIGQLFIPDVKKRMTADECLNHPWITGERTKRGPAQNV